ncbi:MAG: type II toxin-antitoxin system Phd/YefM family antitoxin [Lactobacillales bacterium]|nr:type II toxin-antitoxin system Phd/YefM family antitoxin [Lactobacillales bacterium]
MKLKKLEVPTASITDVKKSPMDIFQQARTEGTGVYIFNREKIAGVMITQEQYELLLTVLEEDKKITTLDEKLIEQEHEAIVDFSHPLEAELRNRLPMMTDFPLKNLDSLMVELGFITKKSGFGGTTEILDELDRTGELRYQLRKKEEGKTIVADIIGVPHKDVTNDAIEIRQVYVSFID